MKTTVLTILIFGLFSCNDSSDKNSLKNESAEESLVQRNEDKINSDSEYKEFCDCDFDTFVIDPKTPKLASDIYLDKEWNLNNDNEVLALLDSLTAKNKKSRPFYFKVVTKSEKKSDGYYTEGLAYAGYNYVLNNTQEFASYFNNKQCHTYKDLATWADIVTMEIDIIGEGDDYKTIVEDYIKKLKSNCKNCMPNQKETINKFGLLLKDK
jgi:hypothetical protein